MPRRYHVDDAGRLRSGWLSNAETDEPDEPMPDKPPNIDAGARSDPPSGLIDMNQWVRDAFGHGSRWP